MQARCTRTVLPPTTNRASKCEENKIGDARAIATATRATLYRQGRRNSRSNTQGSAWVNRERRDASRSGQDIEEDRKTKKARTVSSPPRRPCSREPRNPAPPEAAPRRRRGPALRGWTGCRRTSWCWHAVATRGRRRLQVHLHLLRTARAVAPVGGMAGVLDWGDANYGGEKRNRGEVLYLHARASPACTLRIKSTV